MTTAQPSADEPLRLESDKLLEEIKNRFSEEELEELVFKLSVDSEDVTGQRIDYDDLPGETRTSKALNLIELCDDLNLNHYLLERCNEMRRRDDNWEVFIKKAPVSLLPEEPPPDVATETREAEEKQPQAAETIPVPAAGVKAASETQIGAGQPSASPVDSQIPPRVGKVISKLGGRELAIIGGIGAIITLVIVFAPIILNGNGEEPTPAPEETTKDVIAEDTTEEPMKTPTDTPAITPPEKLVESEGDVGQYTSLALDTAGKPHISYYDKDNGDLKYAFWTGGYWWFAPVDAGPGNNVGQYSSLALDKHDKPHISYYDKDNGDLKYAHGTNWLGYGQGWDWEIDQVEYGPGNNVGQYSSLALDTAGKPHISYYDKDNGDLKYAVWTGGYWWFAPVDAGPGNNVGQYSSLALDKHDKPHISYYDATNGILKYAHGTNWLGYGQGWDWEIDQVESGPGNNVGQYSTLALDTAGKPHISYFDATYGILNYASLTDNGGWFTQTVDGGIGVVVGLYTSLALDKNDIPHISYYDATNGILKYAVYVGSEGEGNCGPKKDWSCDIVNSEGTGGQYTSLALDADGNPHISYYDKTAGNLMYAP